MTIYFISDLHLKAANLENTNLFFRFLEKHALHATAIYILGDFFNIWIGDDYNTPFIQSIKNALTHLYNNNIPVFFMRGNRDFLIGELALAQMHCISIPDPYVIELGEEKILLTHGDLLTTEDKEYRRFRKLVNNPIIQTLFLSLPQKIRLIIASYLRRNSNNVYKKKLQKNPNVFEVSPTVVEAYIKDYKVNGIIHGHTHFPDFQKFVIDNNHYKRIVLGDWGKQAKILAYSDGKYNLIEI